MTQHTRPRGTPGKGLAALIPDDVMDAGPAGAPEPSDRGALRVPLDMLRPNPEQPRTEFDPTALDELSASIREHGVLSPLVVRPMPGGGYTLIAGERRLRAAALAGLTEVPVVVREAPTPEVQLELALVENLQREDLNQVEAARGFARLQAEYGYTQEHIARKVGKDRATVANALRLLKLPESVLRLVQDGRLSAAHARALLPLEDEAAQREVVSQILSRDLSVRAVEALVRARLAGTRRAPGRPARQDPAFRYAGDLLSRSLNTAVRIQPRPRGQGGSIQIDYYTSEDLERLIKRIRGEE